MSRTLRSCLLLALFATVLWVPAAPAWAQGTTACGKFDEDTQLQADLCSAHLGCRMVLKLQSTCTRVTDFLGRVKSAISDGAASLLGRRDALDANQLFDAAIPPESAKAAADPEWSRRSAAVRQAVQGAPRGSLHQPALADPNGKWVFYGQARDGKANGPGVAVFENGDVQRGRFVDNKLEGDAEILRANGVRRLAENVGGKEEGSGFQYYSNGAVYKGGFSGGAVAGQGRLTMSDGEVFEGTFRAGQPVEGSRYRADGTLAERGSFDRFQLSKGQRFDSSGQVTATIDREAERANQEIAQREAALRRQQQAADDQLARQRAEQASRRAAAEQAEGSYRAKLQSGNPGELLALASEMKDAGDLAKSREALRALISRYPDHPLAASAARQLAAPNTSTATAAGSTTSDSSGANAAAPAIPPMVGAAAQTRCAQAFNASEKLAAQMKHVPPDSVELQLRAVIEVTFQEIANFTPCAADPAVAERVRALIAVRNQALTVCRQISSIDRCLVSPFEQWMETRMGIKPLGNTERAMELQMQQQCRAQLQRVRAAHGLTDLGVGYTAGSGSGAPSARTQREMAATRDVLASLQSGVCAHAPATWVDQERRIAAEALQHMSRATGAPASIPARGTCGNGRPVPVDGVCTTQ